MDDDSIAKQVEYWKKSSERDIETARSLFVLKRYDSCLFFCHLAIEKSLKGLVAEKTKEPAPYSHDLPELAELAGLAISEEKMSHLKTISTFNIGGRYDDYKLTFYKKCTREYSEEYLKVAEEIFAWFQQQYKSI